jgi:2-polyprenyl-3-methyl-5-hydroxy-6-metoxy-1,4-benzoquinol methylase
MGTDMPPSRDYNQETQDNAARKYAYGFDYDVMHPFMLRAFLPHIRQGDLLELGCHKGMFTKKLAPHFSHVTCVEAAADALEDAKNYLAGENVEFHHSTFETVSLPKRYKNIVMSHVLEHIGDPVAVLRRVNEEWLDEDGRFFLVCPNANAPSRQIAVKMGLISHNAAVTEGERLHGHHVTYSLDTLERDARAAGLDVVFRTGIFFKALANFQFDRLLQTDIITPEYLEGCYQIGQQYPDLCSSIFLLCKKG